MGGSNSKQTIEDINGAISKNIINSLQNSQSTVFTDQNLIVSCDAQMVNGLIDSYIDCVSGSKSAIRLKNLNGDIDKLKNTCESVTSVCKGEYINMDNIFNVQLNNTQQNEVEQTVKNAIKDTLTQYSGSDSDQKIATNTNITSNLTSDIKQQFTDLASTQQSIKINNVEITYVSQKIAIDITKNILQQNKSLQTVVNDVSNNVSQTTLDQSSYNIFIYIFVIIVVSYFCIKIIMTLKRSPTTKDFFNTMLPYFIWFILSVIITLLHILVPPKYITFTNTYTNKKEINKQKLILYLSIYYISVAILIYVIKLIIDRKKQINKTN